MNMIAPASVDTATNSLGLDKAPGRTRVVVAMSGGVDSSVTAGLLAEEGYDVIGITLQLYDHGEAIKKKGACCAGQDIYDARGVARMLDIPHYVLNYQSRFREDVMEAFADSYLAGETPIPCVMCNQTVKFRDLLQTARDLGADALATGHYVQRVAGPNGAELHRAVDASRDQSYFLFSTTREQLDLLRFPLGGMEKDAVRAHGTRLGLPVAAKPDSQDICFVPGGGYAEIVEKLRPGAAEPGEIVHVDGRVLGTHDGIIHYTVGQRRGLVADGSGEPLYVIRLNPVRRQVIVGPKSAMGETTVPLENLNWIGDGTGPIDGQPVEVKIRSAMDTVPGRFVVAGSDVAVELDDPQRAIAPGQACVFYDAGNSDRVLGGGWIKRAARTEAA